jgi:hypothetical protein
VRIAATTDCTLASMIADPLSTRAVGEEQPILHTTNQARSRSTRSGYDLRDLGQVQPVMVFKVFPDGREQLVRGGSLEAAPLSVLSNIIRDSHGLACVEPELDPRQRSPNSPNSLRIIGKKACSAGTTSTPARKSA